MNGQGCKDETQLKSDTLDGNLCVTLPAPPPARGDHVLARGDHVLARGDHVQVGCTLRDSAPLIPC